MADSQTVAAIDCGTNSIRLLILRSQGGQVRELYRDMQIVRLGEGVNETKRLSEAALARTLKAATEYERICASYGVSKLRFVATSASRDASNAAEFQVLIEKTLGVRPEVISGAEEAALSFSGAVGALPAVDYPALVVDIGGGSTEFVVGLGTGGLSIGSNNVAELRDTGGLQAYSADMGSVRLTEMFPILAQSPTAAQQVEAREWVRSYLDKVCAQVPLTEIATVIGVAGTVTTVSAYALGLENYQPTLIHGAAFTVEQQRRACEYMISAPTVEKTQLGYMPTGRADVIAAGALIWDEILKRLTSLNPELRQVLVSENDILDGTAHGLL